MTRDGQSGPFAGNPSSGWFGRLAIAVVAAAYVAYLALLITCDVRRVALGFVPSFKAGGVIVAELQPDSTAALADLLPGDRLTRANGQVLEGPADWQRVRAHLNPSKPMILGIDRGGRLLSVSLNLRSNLSAWRAVTTRPALLAFRAAQVVTLALAILVAFRRYGQPSALLGAVLLASVATVSLALPERLAAFWHTLPAIPARLLWIPFATSFAVGPLLFAFFAVFPRQVLSMPQLVVAISPAVLVVGRHVDAWHRIMRDFGPPTGVADKLLGVFAINVIYAGLSIALLLLHTRRAATLTDQRRIRVLASGLVVGVLAGAAVVVGHWRNPGADIFASGMLAMLSLAFLAVPASFAYAILRHGLFDVSLIVRQGLRYTLARGFVEAVIPALGAALVIDILLHGEQSLVTLVRTRWWWFAILAAALAVARAYRERWLNGIDRRFFRERYDAQRLLRSIAEQVTRASSFEAVGSSVVQWIDEALHPEFVSVLAYDPGESIYAEVPHGSMTSGPARERLRPLPASLAVVRVLSVLRKPLALSLGSTAWVRQQLPIQEHALLASYGIELLVPICSELPDDPPLGLLVLGPRRSEEPYNQEDLELLVTIARAVWLLFERSAVHAHTMGECETCGRCYDAGVSVCQVDHQRLSMLTGSRVLNGRYCLERRLGRGGMGTVYAALDIVLKRSVAVKLIREHTWMPLDVAARFLDEARAAARFAHPHVVRFYDFGVDRHQRPFLVMELLEGATLRQRLRSGIPFTTSETLHVLRGLCAATSAAHAQSLVHRDLKPENIFLQQYSSDVVAKVLDFGLAKAFNSQVSLDRTTNSSAGLLVGTLDYMAPEQIEGDDVSPLWDVWAITVIAYEMLTASHPFRQTLSFTMDEITDTVTGVAEKGALRLSTTATAFFRLALSADRGVRPRSALELLDACERALS